MKAGLGGWLSAAWLALVIVLLALAPFVARFDPAQPVGPPLSGPQTPTWLGTDLLGRDLWARLVWGGRLSLVSSLLAAGVMVGLGGLAGLTAAVLRGWAEKVILWSANAMLAVPGLLLALLFVAGIGPGLPAVVLAVGLGGAPGFARLARTIFLQVKQGDYVTAATALGAGRAYIAVNHLLPNARPALLSLATTHFAWALMWTTTLTFLGLAGDPSVPEWGAMLNAGRANLLVTPWPAVFPALAISLTVLSIHTLGSRLAQFPVRPRQGAG